MNRREILIGTGATLVGLSTFRLGWAAPAEKKKQKVLYFTRSSGFVHDPVNRKGGKLAFSEKILTEMGKRAGFDVECTQDGSVFDGDLDQYDLIAFYTSGDLTQPGQQKTPAMTAAGKKKLLDAIAAGKGFVGFHSATDSFRRKGDEIDPYIAMIGAEFLTHGAQQKVQLGIASPEFPGVKGIKPESVNLMEEWYAQWKFAKDLHVVLVQETKAMKGGAYNRPPFPATWARKHEKGRVFYTSFGHRDDIWTNRDVQDIMLGGMAWGMGNVEFDAKPNFEQVTPKANQLKN